MATAAATAQPDPNSLPPQAAYVPPQPFPSITGATFDNGLQLHVIERHALPVVTAELIINSGLASEGDRAGAAKITAEWLEAGGAGRWSSRQLREAVDSLGASLEITVSRDAARLSMTVTADRLEPALEILSALVQKPRFDRVEFDKLKQREMERVQSLSRTSGSWMAQMWLQQHLFRLPIGVHPYASYDVLPSELQRLTSNVCRDWFREFVSPRNAFLLLVGDVTLPASRALTDSYFKGWTGPEVRAFNPSAPEGVNKFEIFVVDKPNSTQSDIFLATLGPSRHDPSFALATVAQQVVGGGVSGRLFLDVREKRSLAYATGAGIQDLAAGPSVLYFSAGTQTAKTAEAVGALLEHFEKLGNGQVSTEEIQIAEHFLVDSMPARWEQVQSLASQLAQLRIQSLPNDYYDALRESIARASTDEAARFTSKVFRREQSVLVVAGDSRVIAPTLTKYAAVSVVSPSQGFRLTSQLPRTVGQ
jgi:zinc protease